MKAADWSIPFGAYMSVDEWNRSKTILEGSKEGFGSGFRVISPIDPKYVKPPTVGTSAQFQAWQKYNAGITDLTGQQRALTSGYQAEMADISKFTLSDVTDPFKNLKAQWDNLRPQDGEGWLSAKSGFGIGIVITLIVIAIILFYTLPALLSSKILGGE